MAGPVRIANALCWSPDDTVMYFADSRKGTVWSYDFDSAAGTIENRRVFLEVADSDGVPDGATVDSDGFVWIAHMRGGAVRRYDPAGTLERTIRLYVTTASSRFEPADFEREPDAGSLFAVETDVTGIPEPVFGWQQA